jgi:RNA polymerase sigma-70 factor (ECF subfamily)
MVVRPDGQHESGRAAERHAALMAAIAERGDRAAFAALFNEFAPRLKGFLARSGLPSAAAEELVQETMLAVWRKAGSYDPSRASVATWIYTISRNLRIDLLRRQRSEAATTRPDPSEEGEEPERPDAMMMGLERAEQVREALRRLSKEQSHIVQLSFFAEKPHSQIAQELGIPLGTVKSRVRLAIHRLRSLLDTLP